MIVIYIFVLTITILGAIAQFINLIKSYASGEPADAFTNLLATVYHAAIVYIILTHVVIQ